MSELQRQEPQAQVDLPNTVPVTGTNGHAEQLHVRLRRLEEELKEARQCAAREKAHRERVEQSRDAAVASLKEAKETARKATVHLEQMTKSRDAAVEKLREQNEKRFAAEKMLADAQRKSREESARRERVENSRDKMVLRLREQTEKRRTSEKNLAQVRTEARKAVARREQLEKVLHETRYAMQVLKYEHSKAGKTILFGTVNPENDPKLKMPDPVEDSMLRRAIRCLRKRGVVGTLRKIQQTFRKRK